MRIIIDIAHPAHVHFFKNFIWLMREKGHEIFITAGDKEVTLRLLKEYGFNYHYTCKRTCGYKLILEVLKRDIQMLQFVRKYRPDIVMGVASTIASHVSRITETKSIVFTDTEHTKLADMITYPFSDCIVTPSCYFKNLGEKQVLYNGYHELAYLHPNRFSPNPAVLAELGLKEGDPFIIVRFVSWQASHDIGQHGIRDKVRLVKELEQYGRVMITSEGALPSELQPYQIRVSPEKLHDLLYYATLYVGEGGTTASEAAVLGTHAIHISTTAKYCGIFNSLNRYGLLWTSERDEETIQKAIELLQDPEIKRVGKYKRNCLIDEKIDVTAFMVWFIENYPESVNLMKNDSDSQDTYSQEPKD
jgi:predicted glycosyltransferase